MIERRNVLELIGKNRGKYHSCILTCYSLDFSFFEERVLPVLRTANIKNVNILADGHFLESAQELTTGREFKHNKTYNFLPVYTKGVFHPKIMLLTGVKHGLLIIGSGNMTSSGLSTNDEIWGAFHMDNIGNENAPLFAQAWKYLQEFTSKSHGFVTQKIDWITKYSPWLNELPITEGPIQINNSDQQIEFIANSKERSSYQRLIASIPQKGVESLTIISPYFDKGGVVIEELQSHFGPKVFNCIVDFNSGLLPHNLNPEIASHISFYNWRDCRKDYIETYNRLHAKMFHFKYADGQEYLFVGSANATKAAMGTLSYLAVNDEAGILLYRKISKNWLKELGVIIPDTKHNLEELPKTKGLPSENIKRQKLDHKILYSELRGNELTLFIDSEALEGISIGLESRDDIYGEIVEAKSDKSRLTCRVENAELLFKVFMKRDGQRVSNYSVVHRVESLLRCNPDPSQEKLDALMDDDYPNGEGVTALLQFIDYNWADEEEVKQTNSRIPGGGSSGSNKKVELEREYEKLEASEFNAGDRDMVNHQSGELTHSNVKIAEFLNLINVGGGAKDDAFKESEEQKLLEDEDQKGDGGDVRTSIVKKSIAQKEKTAIAGYFRKLDQSYSEMLSSFFETKELIVAPKEVITIRSLSNILIALQLIQIYHGKKYTILQEEGDDGFMKEESYMLEGSLLSDCDSVKGFFINVYGKFLILAAAGMKEYEYEIINQKLDSNRFQLATKAIFTILNLKWRENEKPYMKTLLLNTLHYINPKVPNQDFCDALMKKLNECKLNAKYVSQGINDALTIFSDVLLSDFVNWSLKFTNMERRRQHLIHPTNELRQGDIVFNGKIGFNVVNRLHKSEVPKLDLVRDGYPRIGDSFVLDGLTYGVKCVRYGV